MTTFESINTNANLSYLRALRRRTTNVYCFLSVVERVLSATLFMTNTQSSSSPATARLPLARSPRRPTIVRAARKAERQRAAMRTALAAAGVTRAEALRVGIEHRCSHSLMDALPVDDVLGTSETSGSLDNLRATLFRRALSCDDELASRFGLKPAGSDPETDLDRAVLQALFERFDASARATMLSGDFKHRDAKVLSSLLVDDETYVQRFEVRSSSVSGSVSKDNASASDDAATFAATFTLDERLAPCYKSASVVKQWALRSVVCDVRE